MTQMLNGMLDGLTKAVTDNSGKILGGVALGGAGLAAYKYRDDIADAFGSFGAMLGLTDDDEDDDKATKKQKKKDRKKAAKAVAKELSRAMITEARKEAKAQMKAAEKEQKAAEKAAAKAGKKASKARGENSRLEELEEQEEARASASTNAAVPRPRVVKRQTAKVKDKASAAA